MVIISPSKYELWKFEWELQINFTSTYQEKDTRVIILKDGFVYYQDFRSLRKALTLWSYDSSHAWLLMSSVALVIALHLFQI